MSCALLWRTVLMPIFSFTFTDAVYGSGLLSAIACICLGAFCILSIIQIASISSKDKVVLPYRTLVVVKLVLAILAGM